MIINNQQLKALAGGRPGGRKGEIREICCLTLMGNLCAALPSCLRLSVQGLETFMRLTVLE